MNTNEIAKRIMDVYFEVSYWQKLRAKFADDLRKELSSTKLELRSHLKQQRKKVGAKICLKDVNIRDEKILRISKKICHILSPQSEDAMTKYGNKGKKHGNMTLDPEGSFDTIAGVRKASVGELEIEDFDLEAYYKEIIDESETPDPSIYYSLLNLHELELTPKETPYQFQPKWLNNTANFLPANPQVLKILPFLITCYMANIHNNKQDNFSTKEIPHVLQSGYSDDLRDTLIGYFCDVKSNSTHFFSLERAEADEYSVFEETKYTLSKARESMICWELIRRFAGCVVACNDCDEVNLTLSFMLFSKLFDDIDNGETVDLKITWDDIRADCYRNELQELFLSIEGSGTLTGIDEIAYYMREDFCDVLHRSERPFLKKKRPKRNGK